MGGNEALLPVARVDWRARPGAVVNGRLGSRRALNRGEKLARARTLGRRDWLSERMKTSVKAIRV